MVEPTKACIEYANKTGGEIWYTEEKGYFVVYPTAREAHVHGLAVLDFVEMYDVGVFDVTAVCKSVLDNFLNIRRVV